MSLKSEDNVCELFSQLWRCKNFYASLSKWLQEDPYPTAVQFENMRNVISKFAYINRNWIEQTAAFAFLSPSVEQSRSLPKWLYPLTPPLL